MTSFYFDPSPGNISFDFMTYNSKYKFNFKPKILSHLSNLFDYYLTYNFTELNHNLNDLYKSDVVFLTDEDCANIIDYFNKILLIRNFIKKRLFFSRQSKSDWKIINTEDLSLTKFNSDDNNLIFVRDYSTKSLYVFRINELMSLFKYSLYNNDDEFPMPIPIKNPYTGTPFNITQNIYIYNFILKYYCKINKSLPEYFLLFKNSYFNTTNFYNKYHVILHFNAINQYVKSMSYNDWLFNLVEEVINNTFFCLKCFKKKRNLRHIFSNTLQLFLLNQNNIYTYGDAIDEFITICKQNNLYFPKNHKLSHRVQRRIIRNGRTYRSVINPPEFIVNSLSDNNNITIQSNDDSQNNNLQYNTNQHIDNPPCNEYSDNNSEEESYNISNDGTYNDSDEESDETVDNSNVYIDTDINTNIITHLPRNITQNEMQSVCEYDTNKSLVDRIIDHTLSDIIQTVINNHSE